MDAAFPEETISTIGIQIPTANAYNHGREGFIAPRTPQIVRIAFPGSNLTPSRATARALAGLEHAGH